MTKHKSRLLSWIAVLGLVSSSVGAFQTPDTNNLLTTSILSSVSADSAIKHLQEFQKISEENSGHRGAGSLGHEMSANYVAQQLLAAGYYVEFQPFRFKKYSKLGDGIFEIQGQQPVQLKEGQDFEVMSYSGSGDVMALITAVDVALGLGNASSSGCEADDFKDFPSGNIALVQRGTCAFGDKVKNAANAGAVGAIIFNQGDTEDRKGLFAGTLGEDVNVSIPVMATTYDLGEQLAKFDSSVHIAARTEVIESVTFNVIAETRSGSSENIVMIGSHLDGVEEGPGINDNGSGSAGILEVALKIQNLELNNKIRFAWWSAEELGLIGSTKYVESLSEDEKSKIALYLNFDMIGSPNYILGVYDGDGSNFESVGPQGSSSIESLLKMFLSAYGNGSVETPLNGRSDYQSFALAGIPVGGIFTGAEGVKSREEAALFGGEAGKAYDSCYHQACDDLKNISMEALDINVDAIAFAALTYAHSTESIDRAAHTSLNAKQAHTHIDSDIVSLGCHKEAYAR